MTINLDFLMIFAMPVLGVGFSLLIYALFSVVDKLAEWIFGYGR